jgi:hypothetical protein
MSILKKISLLIAIFTIMSVLVLGTPSLAYATAGEEVCKGVNPTTGVCNSGSSVTTVIKTVINLLSWIVGAISVIIIIAGLGMVTSGGEPEKAKKAKSTITYALVGLVIVALAQIIVRFVIKQVN